MKDFNFRPSAKYNFIFNKTVDNMNMSTFYTFYCHNLICKMWMHTGIYQLFVFVANYWHLFSIPFFLSTCRCHLYIFALHLPSSRAPFSSGQFAMMNGGRKKRSSSKLIEKVSQVAYGGIRSENQSMCSAPTSHHHHHTYSLRTALVHYHAYQSEKRGGKRMRIVLFTII